MSSKKKRNLTSSKLRNVKQSVVSSSGQSEVTTSYPEGACNKNAFANITHKNSSGANNWTKFAESLQQGKGQSYKKTHFKLQNQIKTTKSLSVDETNMPSKLSSKPWFSKSQINQRQFSSSTGAGSQNILLNPVLRKKDIAQDFSSQNQKPILTKHIAMDCEMVGVEIGVNKNMLARISLVNSHGDCIYDKFVKPTEPVIDYRTRVSGVRPNDLENASEFEEVQKEVAEIIKGRILVGHALKNDLKVLYLSHPKHSIRDTSRFQKFREGKTPALKKLAKKYLGVSIQEGEHSSIQDALAAMQLYKMFKKEWESSIYSKKHQAKKLEKSNPNQLNLNKCIEL